MKQNLSGEIPFKILKHFQKICEKGQILQLHLVFCVYTMVAMMHIPEISCNLSKFISTRPILECYIANASQQG